MYSITFKGHLVSVLTHVNQTFQIFLICALNISNQRSFANHQNVHFTRENVILNIKCERDTDDELQF